MLGPFPDSKRRKPSPEQANWCRLRGDTLGKVSGIHAVVAENLDPIDDCKDSTEIGRTTPGQAVEEAERVRIIASNEEA